MKFVQQLYASPAYARAAHFVKLASITGSAQALLQIIGVVTGIMIIRILPVQEYAYYTIANTMLGTMVMLSDGGIMTGVMSQGGKVWQDKQKLGVVLATGLDLRKKFAIFSLLVCAPILVYLLLRQGASWFTCSLIILALIPAFLASLSDSLLEVVPKLHQDMKPLQGNQLIVGIGRLLLSGLFLFFSPFTFAVLLANGLPRIYGNIRLKTLSNKFVEPGQVSSPEVRTEMINLTKKVLPITIYHSLSSQITIWILSLAGSTTSLAQIGALGRLTMFISFFSVLSTNLILPRFARLSADRKGAIIKFFLSVQFIVFAFAISAILFAWLFQGQLLWVLGKSYANLREELLLSVVATCISLIANETSEVLVSRGWVLSPVTMIGISVLSLIASIWLFDLTNIFGMLYYNILLNSFFYLVLVVFSFFKLSSINK